MKTSNKVEECNHTKVPDGYVTGLDWLERMSKRYEQAKCKKCGLWAIWRVKK